MRKSADHFVCMSFLLPAFPLYFEKVTARGMDCVISSETLLLLCFVVNFVVLSGNLNLESRLLVLPVNT